MIQFVILFWLIKLANLYVTIISDDKNRDEVLNIKNGDTVVVIIDGVDDHLVNSIYLFAMKYEI